MPNAFEQSVPPSIDKLYRNLPVGPFGVTPYIRPARRALGQHRRSQPRAEVDTLFRRWGRWLAALAAPIVRRAEAKAAGVEAARCCPGT